MMVGSLPQVGRVSPRPWPGWSIAARISGSGRIPSKELGVCCGARKGPTGAGTLENPKRWWERETPRQARAGQPRPARRMPAVTVLEHGMDARGSISRLESEPFLMSRCRRL